MSTIWRDMSNQPNQSPIHWWQRFLRRACPQSTVKDAWRNVGLDCAQCAATISPAASLNKQTRDFSLLPSLRPDVLQNSRSLCAFQPTPCWDAHGLVQDRYQYQSSFHALVYPPLSPLDRDLKGICISIFPRSIHDLGPTFLQNESCRTLMWDTPFICPVNWLTLLLLFFAYYSY